MIRSLRKRNVFMFIAWAGLLVPRIAGTQVETMIDVGAHRLFYQLHGRGTPTVVIDVGVGESFQSWLPIVSDLSKTASVLVYDRAGYGQSDMGPLPRNSKAEAADLEALLQKANIKGPYVLVGHSLGGLNTQVFAREYPADVIGLILLDPTPRGWLAGDAFAGLKRMFLRVTEDTAKAAAAAEQSRNENERRQAPFLRTVASEHEEMFGSTARRVLDITSFGNLRMVVIASGRPNPMFGEEAEAFQKYWIEESKKLARLSSSGEFVLAERSSHQIHQDAPELVLAAIKKLLAGERADLPGPNGMEKAGATLLDPKGKLIGPYFGQKPPETIPQVFAPGIVSTSAHEFACSFMPDGKEFYFTRRETPQSPTLIMVSKCVDGVWTKPEAAPFNEPLKSAARPDCMSFEPLATPDGRRLYFSSDRPLPGQAPGGPPMLNIWYVEREGDGWSAPKYPSAPFNPMKTMYVSMTSAGTIYTADISRGMSANRIAVSRPSAGVYQSLVDLGAPINDGAINNYPYIAPDESYLIFSRRSAPGAPGSLLISFRNSDGTWGEPRAIDLGPLSAGQGVISPDGKYLFFSSGERGKGDIYWVSAFFLIK